MQVHTRSTILWRWVWSRISSTPRTWAPCFWIQFQGCWVSFFVFPKSPKLKILFDCCPNVFHSHRPRKSLERCLEDWASLPFGIALDLRSGCVCTVCDVIQGFPHNRLWSVSQWLTQNFVASRDFQTSQWNLLQVDQVKLYTVSTKEIIIKKDHQCQLCLGRRHDFSQIEKDWCSLSMVGCHPRLVRFGMETRLFSILMQLPWGMLDDLGGLN